MTAKPLVLERMRILAHRRRAGALEERLPWSDDSLRRAAWVGLQDSMPRAALLSIHARVAGTQPNAWEDPSLVQLWGPRFQVYVVPARDHALFSVARYPTDARGQRVAEEMAARLHELLGGRRRRYDDAGAEIGINANAFRYGAATGTILLRWEGARRPIVWTVPRPEIEPAAARLELARRYVHLLGPMTASSFAKWAGIGAREGGVAFEGLAPELTPVRSPIGNGWILTSDEDSMRAEPGLSAPARLLPSGDAYWLLWGTDRNLLVPDADRREKLWTSRVWPGALLVGGDVVGTWRRANTAMSIELWRRLIGSEREAVEAEAAALPLPGIEGQVRVSWVGP